MTPRAALAPEPGPVMPPRAPGLSERAWRVPNTKLVWPQLGEYPFRGIWSPDGSLALAAGDRGPAVLVGSAQAAPVLGLPVSGRFYGAVWSLDSERLMLADRDNGYRFTLVELGKGEAVASYGMGEASGGDPPPSLVGFLPDGKRLLTWGKGEARILDAATGRALSSFKASAPLALFSRQALVLHGVSETKDGIQQVTAFRIVDAETGRSLLEVKQAPTSAVWSEHEPRLALTTDRATLLWDAKRGLRSLSVTGRPVWGNRGRRLAIAPGPYSGGSEYRCQGCLQPVPWHAVFDFDSLEEVSSEVFDPEQGEELLATNVVRHVATGSERALPKPPTDPRAVFSFRDDAVLLGAARPLYFRVDLRTGKVTDWERASADERPATDDETPTVCENGRWAVYERFSRRVLGRLPDDLGCTGARVTILKLPIVAHFTNELGTIVDTASGKTLARLEGTGVGRSGQPYAVTVRVKDKPSSRPARPGEYRPATKLARCELYDAERRRRSATPEFPTEPWGTACSYDPERGFVGGPQGLRTRFVYREGRGFLQPDGRRAAKAAAFCVGTYHETEHGGLCLEDASADMARTFRVWSAATDRVRVVRLDEKTLVSPGSEGQRYLEQQTFVLDPSEGRLAFVASGDTFVLELATGVAKAWGPPGHRPTRWLDAHTLVVTDRSLSFARERLGGTAVVKDGVTLGGPPPPDPKYPPVRGLLPDEVVTLSPAKRWAIQGLESPYFLSRLSDGAYLELHVVEEGGRPYSVLVDSEGYFAGDDQAAAKLRYGVGSGPRDAVVKNGVEMAAKFRNEARLRAFVEAR